MPSSTVNFSLNGKFFNDYPSFIPMAHLCNADCLGGHSTLHFVNFQLVMVCRFFIFIFIIIITRTLILLVTELNQRIKTRYKLVVGWA